MFKNKTTYKYILTIAGVMIVAMIVLVAGVAPDSLQAASHREAPLISMDPEADITDFFMFRSYEGGKENKVVLIMDVIPGEEPSSGPNYWNFDPNVRYEFHIDNNADGKAGDVEFFIQFKNEFRGERKIRLVPILCGSTAYHFVERCWLRRAGPASEVQRMDEKQRQNRADT